MVYGCRQATVKLYVRVSPITVQDHFRPRVLPELGPVHPSRADIRWGGFFGSTFYLLRHSEAYELAASNLQASTEAADILGPLISTGLPLGSISTSLPLGSISTSGTGLAVLRFGDESDRRSRTRPLN
jgi:hypothetical protein